ncbi:MAG TPA: alpha/beta hydrolase [Bryobacteraceae bacterium]|nr:alpha/beta hydrolase [Bryobacteraceae bacterium]
MHKNVARRHFLQRIAAGSGALAFAGSETPAAAEDKYLTSVRLDNFNLYYELHGDGPPVVFAHGAGGTHMSWWQQVPAVSQKYKCITIDHRTFGYSRDLKDGPGRRAFVQDLRGLLDQLGIQKTALVGQSMGGSTVLGFAAAHPDRVSALIMSDTTGGYSSPQIAELRRTLAPAPASIDRAFAPGFAKRDPARAFLYREINALTQAANQPPAAQQNTPAASTDIRPVLDKKIPVLFIVGEQDQLIPPPIIEAMHKQMPGSQLVKVPGAGHSVYFEKPDDYNRILLDFLNQHAAA